MIAGLHPELVQRLEVIDALPAIPSVVRSLFEEFGRESDAVRFARIIDLISAEETLACLCVRLANSPLFGRHQHIETIRGAVLTLGINKLQALLLSAWALQITPAATDDFHPARFWEHSFACALVTRRLARMLRFCDVEKAYLAGLLHDIGSLAIWIVAPQHWADILQRLRSGSEDLTAAELSVIGATHPEVGRNVAQRWGFPPDLVTVIACHHAPELAPSDCAAITALVNIADRLSCLCGVGYETAARTYGDFFDAPAWQILQDHFGRINRYDFARLTADLGDFLKDTKTLVNVFFRSK